MDAFIDYFSGLNIMHFFGSLPSTLTQGLIFGVMAVGVFMTFRILNIADLTVDGSFATGGAVTIMMMLSGRPSWVSLIVAVGAGILAGAVTGIIHTLLGIPAILAGILSQLGLYSINLVIMGMSPNRAVNATQRYLLMTGLDLNRSILFGFIIVLVLLALLYWFFGTELGSALRATGSNISMSQAQGININFIKILGLALSNGIVALAGSLFAQYQGASDVNMGRGIIVIGLAAVIIGEVLGDALFKKRMNFAIRLIFLVIGGIVYQLIVTLVLWLELDTNMLKLFTSVVVAIFLAVPYLKGQRMASFKRAFKNNLRKSEEEDI